jgi:antitoxin component YwqK of YwqJK toxin-antitoxin module
VTTRIDIQAEPIAWDDSHRMLHNGVPFTGEAVTYNWLDEVTSLITYVDGIREGVQREWYDGEDLKAERTVHRGRIVGPAREWRQNGQLAKEKQFDERGLPVSESLWDEDGQPIGGHGKL